MERYEKVAVLGEGMFGIVHLARSRVDGRLVALKKIRLGESRLRDGVHFTALRELKLLGELRHDNVLALIDMFAHKQALFMALELARTDLEIVIKQKHVPLALGSVRHFVREAARGLAFLNRNWVLHRDVKPSNMLVHDDARLVLADFGLARMFGGSGQRPMTHQVVTRWYRSPELLFGARYYGEGVDSWALGCVLAELLLRNPFLPGETDIDQLHRIAHCRGTPKESVWPGVEKLRDFVKLPAFEATPWRDMFVAADDDTLTLLDGLLTLDPRKRLSCEDALKQPFFTRPTAAQWGEFRILAEQHVKKLPAGYEQHMATAEALKKQSAENEMALDAKVSEKFKNNTDGIAKKLF